MATTHPGTRQCVAAIAGFGESVGSEADSRLGPDDVLDDRGIIPIVDVIDELGSLVPEVTGVLELRRTFHDPSRY